MAFMTAVDDVPLVKANSCKFPGERPFCATPASCLPTGSRALRRTDHEHHPGLFGEIRIESNQRLPTSYQRG